VSSLSLSLSCCGGSHFPLLPSPALPISVGGRNLLTLLFLLPTYLMMVLTNSKRLILLEITLYIFSFSAFVVGSRWLHHVYAFANVVCGLFALCLLDTGAGHASALARGRGGSYDGSENEGDRWEESHRGLLLHDR
jgi:hypothetical protein